MLGVANMIWERQISRDDRSIAVENFCAYVGGELKQISRRVQCSRFGDIERLLKPSFFADQSNIQVSPCPLTAWLCNDDLDG
jgi:hypothetical protein